MEANPLFETGFSPGCPFFSFDFSSRSASTMRKREAGNPSRSASALASSALLSICCVHKRRSLSAAASAPGRMDFLSPRNTIVEIFGFYTVFFMIQKKIPLFLCLPHRARGRRLRRSGTAVKSKNEADAFRVCLILFHSASILSGSLRSPLPLEGVDERSEAGLATLIPNP